MMEHIDTESALDALEGRLSPQETERVRHHLGECHQCAEAFSSYSAMLDALSQPALKNAPYSAIHQATATFQPVKHHRSSFQENIASLLFDSWTQPAVAGLRGQAETRQLAMTADEFDLHVGVVYNNTGNNIRGQLLQRDEGNFVSQFDVLLLDARNAELDAAVADELGEFSFHDSPAEATTIAIQLEDGRIIKCQLPEEGDQQ